MKPFRVSEAYVDWAHGSAAAENQPLAARICLQPPKAAGDGTFYLELEDPQLVAEVADVAELYVGGQDNDLRAARVRSRAIAWLKERGLTVKQALKGQEVAA